MIDELDEVGEITFIYEGKVLVGYEINKVKKYCLQFQDTCVIGAYNVVFNQKSVFVYASLTKVKGFTIRKDKWMEIMGEFPKLELGFKKNIMIYYLTYIRGRVMV